MARGDGRLVAVGFRHWEEPAISDVLVSDDRGRTWRAAGEDGLDTGSMVAVTHGPAGFVAVGRAGGGGPGRSAAIWASPDGLDWLPVDPPTTVAGADLQAVVASSDRYVAGGMDGPMPVVWVSSDGQEWQEAPPFYGPAEYQTDADITGDAVSALATRDGRFVAALSVGAHRGEIWSSDDGQSWVKLGRIEPNAAVAALTWDENGLLAVGSDMVTGQPHGRIWSSPDGVTWDEVASLGAGDGLDVSAGSDVFVAASISQPAEPGIWRSSDGVSWVQAALPDLGTPSPILQALLAVDDAIVGVGSRGATADDVTMVVWHGTPTP